MPQISKVLKAEDLTRRTGAAGALDLSTYREMIDEVVAEGVGAMVSLGEGEQQRTEKRRLSLAAKDRGYHLTWRKAPEGSLRFVLARPGEQVPGGRQRRKKAVPEPPPVPEPAPAPKRRRKAS